MWLELIIYLSRLFKINIDFQGVVIHLEGSNVNLRVVKAVSVFNKIIIQQIGTEINEINEQYTFLTITGDKIVSNFTHKLDSTESLVDIYPGIKISDFYLQIIQGSNCSIVSLIRKADYEKCIELMKGISNKILNVTLGPYNFHETHRNTAGTSKFIFQNVIYSYINDLPSNISYYNDELTELEKSTYNITQNDPLTELAKATIISNLIHPKQNTKSLTPQLVENSESFKYSNLFKRTFILGLLILIITLMLNRWYYVRHQDNFKVSQRLYADYISISNSIDSIKSFVDNRISISKSLGVSSGLPTSYIIDRLSASVPNKILVKSISVYSLFHEPFSDSFFVNKSKIDVQGSGSTSEINKWVAILKQLDFIKGVSISNFSQSPSNSGDFKLSIQIHDTES